MLNGTNEIEIWGDGLQTPSFTYIDDCVEGTLRLTASDVREPLNIGSEQLVTINELVDIVEGIAGVTLKRNYNTSAPQGVRGRNSDNTLINERLGWAPSITLEDGLQNTYKWIFDQMSEGCRPSPADHSLEPCRRRRGLTHDQPGDRSVRCRRGPAVAATVTTRRTRTGRAPGVASRHDRAAVGTSAS